MSDWGWLRWLSPLASGLKALRGRLKHEGDWVQMQVDGRVIWMTERARNTCYLGLDDRARAREDNAFRQSAQSRFYLSDLERLSK